MKLSVNQSYQHIDINSLLKLCPICGSADELAVWSMMTDASVNSGREGVSCDRCALDLAFSFEMDQDGEIIDAYTLEHFKFGNLEFKNNEQQLVLYLNNTYVKDIDSNIVDFAKCKQIAMIS